MMLQRRCLECYYAVREPNPSPDQVIAGETPTYCMAIPPAAQLVAGNAGMVAITFYPVVNGTTVSCGSFTAGSIES